MTIQQLKYVIAVAEAGSMKTGRKKSGFASRPSTTPSRPTPLWSWSSGSARGGMSLF